MEYYSSVIIKHIAEIASAFSCTLFILIFFRDASIFEQVFFFL